MSGICAIVQPPGHPVDRELLQAMTVSMAFRGPDGQETWDHNHVGLGHAWLRTDPFTPPVKQPATLDGKVWITADARIDDRQELTRQLTAAGRQVKPDADDAVMILHAYMAWDTACLDRLLGDFCFVIWDEARQRLFCARDHFGIKPLFYARLGNTLVVSNTLNTIRLHPGVSNELDDLAVADFLLFGNGQEPDGTIFADIRRLPAGHAFTWSAEGGWRLWRYWQMPEDYGTLQLPKHEYVDAFMERFEQAVADRVRTNRVGIELSGGMDSTSVAAVAKRSLARRGQTFELHALTCVYNEWIPDEERRYAYMAAKYLDIPVTFLARERHALLAPPGNGFVPPEPVNNLQPSSTDEFHELASNKARVWLTGWDGDALLSESIRPHLASLRFQGKYLELAASLVSFAWINRHHFRWPVMRKHAEDRNAQPMDGYPLWMNPEIEARLKLRERWMNWQAGRPDGHALRPYGYASFKSLADDDRLFDCYDPGFTGRPVQYHHPMMDLRLIGFCLALPVQPWAIKKHILREAMAGHLPNDVLRRRKSPLPGDPNIGLLLRDGAHALTPLSTHAALGKYVTVSGIFKVSAPHGVRQLVAAASEIPAQMRPKILELWLATLDAQPPLLKRHK